jgi:hypothetical protein
LEVGRSKSKKWEKAVTSMGGIVDGLYIRLKSGKNDKQNYDLTLSNIANSEECMSAQSIVSLDLEKAHKLRKVVQKWKKTAPVDLEATRDSEDIGKWQLVGPKEEMPEFRQKLEHLFSQSTDYQSTKYPTGPSLFSPTRTYRDDVSVMTIEVDAYGILTAGATVANEENTIHTQGSYKQRRQKAMEDEPEPRFLGLDILDFPKIVNTSRKTQPTPQSYAAALNEDSSLQSGNNTIESQMSELTLENASLKGSVATLKSDIASQQQEHDQEMVTVKKDFNSQLATVQEHYNEKLLKSDQAHSETKLQLVSVQSNMTDLRKSFADQRQETAQKHAAAEEKAEAIWLQSEAKAAAKAEEAVQKAAAQSTLREQELLATVKADTAAAKQASDAKAEAAELKMMATMRAMMLQVQPQQVAAPPPLEFPAQPDPMATPTKPKLKRAREETPSKDPSVAMQIQDSGGEQLMDPSVANPSPTQMEVSSSPVMDESMHQSTQDLDVSVDSDDGMLGESPNRKLDFHEEAQPSALQESNQADDNEFDSVDLIVESSLEPKHPTLSQVTGEMEDLDLQPDDIGELPTQRRA